MIAVLYECELDIGAAEKIDKVEGVPPGDVGIAHALQDAHRRARVE
jgi:hypothetical protein